MIKAIKWIFGMPLHGKEKHRKYEVRPIMINPDLVRMDLDSLRKSKVFVSQCKAASKIKTQPHY